MLSQKQLEAIEIAVCSADGNTDVSDAIQGAVAAGAIAPITTPNATDLASAEALANQCKATINALLAALAG